MAEVQFARLEAQGGHLPQICLQCGAPSTEVVSRRFTTDQTYLMLPPDEPIGCFVVWPFLALLKLLSWSAATTMDVRIPLCRRHARGWFTWSSLTAKSISTDSIVLGGVSDQFAQAWQQQRPPVGTSEQPVIKVRCRSCQSLNDESSKYCGQCGSAL